MTQSQIVIYAGLVMGALAMISVCIVWLSKQVLGVGGGFLGLVGVTLMGLSIWKNVGLSIGKDGIEAKYQALEGQVAQLAGATRTVTDSVQQVAAARTADQTRIADLLAALRSNPAATPGSLEAFREAARTSTVDEAALQRSSEQLRRIETQRMSPQAPAVNVK